MFKEKPWQGNDPAKAEFIFLGLDANFSANVERVLPEIFEYLHYGVDFWREKKVHHPFLLPHYRGSGKKYHEKFAEIGFTSKHAELVSFVELLHLPTEGKRKLELVDLAENHLKFISDIIQGGRAKYIFTFSGVADILRKTKLFQWLPRDQIAQHRNLKVLWESNGKRLYKMHHFSCHYEGQLKILDEQINQIRQIVESIH